MTFVFSTSNGEELANPAKYINEHPFLQNWNATVLLCDNNDHKGVAPHIMIEVPTLRHIAAAGEREGVDFIIRRKNLLNSSTVYPGIELINAREEDEEYGIHENL